MDPPPYAQSPYGPAAVWTVALWTPRAQRIRQTSNSTTAIPFSGAVTLSVATKGATREQRAVAPCKTGTRLGQDWDKTGTRPGRDRDKTGTRLGQDWDKTGTRPGQDWDLTDRLIPKIIEKRPPESDRKPRKNNRKNNLPKHLKY